MAIRIQRSIAGPGDLPIQPLDSILNIDISSNLTIVTPLASLRGGFPLTFKNLATSVATATITATSPDEFDLLPDIPLGPGGSITLWPADDNVNSGYAIG